MLRLKELREEKSISQQKLVENLGISQASVSKYEKGLAEPNLQLLCRMAEYFHVSADYLIGKSEHKSPLQTDSLSEEDAQLLYRFQTLAPHQQEKVQIYIAGLLDL